MITTTHNTEPVRMVGPIVGLVLGLAVGAIIGVGITKSIDDRFHFSLEKYWGCLLVSAATLAAKYSVDSACIQEKK